MDRRTQMRGLVQMASLRFRAAQAEMAELLARETSLRDSLAQLTKSKNDQASAQRDSNEAALIAGADIRWHQWVDQRKAVINIELAQVLVLKDSCRAKLQQAFGREQASRAVLENENVARKRDLRRRSDYVS